MASFAAQADAVVAAAPDCSGSDGGASSEAPPSRRGLRLRPRSSGGGQWDSAADLVCVVNAGRGQAGGGGAAGAGKKEPREAGRLPRSDSAWQSAPEKPGLEAGAAADEEQLPYRIGLTREEAPAHVTYPFVLTGYRAGGTYARCARAAFELHSETFNAWTMVWGCAASLALLWYARAALAAAGPPPAGRLASPSAAAAGGAAGGGGLGELPEATPFALMTAAVLLHAPWSVAFHLFRCISPRVYNLWRRLDQVFIFQVSQLLTLGIAWFVYDSWLGLGLNVAAAVVTAQAATRDIWKLPAHYQRPRGLMVAFVASIVACYWAPMGVQAARDLSAAAAARLAGDAAPAPPLLAAGCAAGALGSLAAGAAVFAAGFPERWYPRTFDVFGFSHQLMHLGALSAHVFEYVFVLEMWARRRAAAAETFA